MPVWLCIHYTSVCNVLSSTLLENVQYIYMYFNTVGGGLLSSWLGGSHLVRKACSKGLPDVTVCVNELVFPEDVDPLLGVVCAHQYERGC